MDHGHLSKRRGYVDDSSEPVLDNSSFGPSYSPSFHHYTSSHPPIPDHQEGILPTFTFHGILPQDTSNFGQQYRQRQDSFPEQQQQLQRQHQQPHQHQQALRGLDDYYPQAESQYQSRKRQRIDSNMPLLGALSRPSVGQDEKTSFPQYFEDGNNGSRPTVFQQIGNFLCHPCSNAGYEISPAYHPIPQTPMYDGTTLSAQSVSLQSPAYTPMPDFMAIPSPEATEPGLLGNSGSHHVPQLQERWPLLQPSFPLYQQTPSEEVMKETCPLQTKSESSGHDFALNDFPTRSSSTAHVDSNYLNLDAPAVEKSSYASQVVVTYSPPTTNDYMAPENDEQLNYYELTSQEEMEATRSRRKPPAVKRGPFKSQEKRDHTAAVRKVGSCIRCRMQRIRCEFHPSTLGDFDAPCDGCKKIGLNSKIHRMPCKRWKLIDVRLHKPGPVPGHEWTHRWRDGTALPEIKDWEPASMAQTIKLTDGWTEMVVQVRKFKVVNGADKTARSWYENGRLRKWEIEPYGLVNVEAVKTDYEAYMRSMSCLQNICKSLCGPTQKLLWRTYELAFNRKDQEHVTMAERILLKKTLSLWVAVRLTTKSFNITGKENLGIRPDPRNGKYLLPPVMGAQLDRILLDHSLPKIRRETLELLQTMTQHKKQNTWLTTYLVTFILLHNVALLTGHDRSYAEKHGMDRMYARPNVVKEYHLGANILLAYFHYCNKGLYPFSNECKESDLANLAELDQHSIDYVYDTRNYIENHRHQWEVLRSDQDYSNDYFFVSQLYEKNWIPQDTDIPDKP